ncbi:hypothetical protein CEXT_58771 [Caerostris extrusa]|uniref:Uncharacterized protein n=1 Tax=Caerostris extrusa TaxID=172846 RepID=A0AAV4V1S8_CAEEX|nr:hypothetical protein CEXT_58771 [Caerostris extrusa]
MPVNTVHRILCNILRYYPYKITDVQELIPADLPGAVNVDGIRNSCPSRESGQLKSDFGQTATRTLPFAESRLQREGTEGFVKIQLFRNVNGTRNQYSLAFCGTVE